MSHACQLLTCIDFALSSIESLDRIDLIAFVTLLFAQRYMIIIIRIYCPNRVTLIAVVFIALSHLVSNLILPDSRPPIEGRDDRFSLIIDHSPLSSAIDSACVSFTRVRQSTPSIAATVSPHFWLRSTVDNDIVTPSSLPAPHPTSI